MASPRNVKTVILRIDDVGAGDWPTAAVLSALVAGGFPVACLVVPAWVSSPTAGFVCNLMRNPDARISIVQHGFGHSNWAREGERKYEFGPSRAASEQAHDIRSGRRMLEQWFGSDLPRTFAPPHDRLDQTTLDVLAAEGFSQCLGSPLTFVGLQVPASLATLSFGVDTSVRNGQPRRSRPSEEVAAEIKASFVEQVGVVIHPREFESSLALAELYTTLSELRNSSVMFISLSDSCLRSE
jgi:hypothetical protein